MGEILIGGGGCGGCGGDFVVVVVGGVGVGRQRSWRPWRRLTVVVWRA